MKWSVTPSMLKLISRLKPGAPGGCLLYFLIFFAFSQPARGQYPQLLNVGFGGAAPSAKVGPAAIGNTTNDYWNADASATASTVSGLEWSDKSACPVPSANPASPEVGGLSTGDKMYDYYLYTFENTATAHATELAGENREQGRAGRRLRPDRFWGGVCEL